MQAYLPKDAAGSSGYTEGGALYALGLIHVNHGAAIIDYLVQQLKEANNEVRMAAMTARRRWTVVVEAVRARKGTR